MKGSRRLWAVSVLGAGSLLLSQALWAEGDWVWHFNTGYADTIGETSDYLKGGWTVGGGFAFQPDAFENLALQIDLGYSDMSATNKLIQLGQQHSPVRIDSGRGSLGLLTVAGKYHLDFADDVRGYGLLGIGGYHRYVELSQTALFGGAICDPWWGYCYPGVVAGQAIVASRSTFKFGYNAGVGVEWQTSGAGVWFIEARYHRTAGSHPTEILPIQIGLRF
jgi:opacity protein-like surface antigen